MIPGGYSVLGQYVHLGNQSLFITTKTSNTTPNMQVFSRGVNYIAERNRELLKKIYIKIESN